MMIDMTGKNKHATAQQTIKMGDIKKWIIGAAMGTIVSLTATSIATGSRQDDGFSSDPVAFVEEMTQIFNQSTDVKRAESAIAEMTQFVNTGDANMVELFRETCEQIKKKKGKAFPDYITALKTYEIMSQSPKIQEKTSQFGRKSWRQRARNWAR